MPIVLVISLFGCALCSCKSNKTDDSSKAKPEYGAAPVLAAASTSPSTGGESKDLTLDLGGGVMMKLVKVPAGKFTMGSPVSEKDRVDDEGPQREVTISKAFYMGIYEVTQEQYESVMGKNPSKFRGAKIPVEQVSWDDAAEFCKKLSRKTGETVSLPTEAQWEYACRAGTRTAFGFGGNEADLADHAWYFDNSEARTHPVGEKKPNAWGLYDMHGNVWEWCLDYYADSYANAKATDPHGPASGTSRVVRGSSWVIDPQSCRSAIRFRISPIERVSVYGFRVAVDSN
jgi:formylglycine-generating enzyme required for sulfatase activity